jgi:hypothetical protein
MNSSEARITTERASIYLQQLCKHFAHRLPVEFTPERGQITFSNGTCRLTANSDVLTLEADSGCSSARAAAGGCRAAPVAVRLPRSARDHVDCQDLACQAIDVTFARCLVGVGAYPAT